MSRLWTVVAVAALVLCVMYPDLALAFGGGGNR